MTNPSAGQALIPPSRIEPHPTAEDVRSGGVARGALMCALAAVLWGSVGIAQALLPAGGASPYWLAVLRLFFAVAVFGLLIAFERLRARDGRTAERLVARHAALRRAAPRALLAGVAIAGFNLFYFEGVKACGVGIGAAAIIGSAPIWTGLLLALFLKQRPSALWAAGVAAAVAGGALMLTGGELALAVPVSGLLVCLSAGLCYAVYTCVSKALIEDVTPLEATAMTFTTALLIAAPAAWALSGAPVLTANDIAAGLWLGVVATGAAYLLFTTGLKRISAGTGTALTLLEPVTAFVLSVSLVGEPLTAAKGLGLAGILFGLAFVLRAEKR